MIRCTRNGLIRQSDLIVLPKWLDELELLLAAALPRRFLNCPSNGNPMFSHMVEHAHDPWTPSHFCCNMGRASKVCWPCCVLSISCQHLTRSALPLPIDKGGIPKRAG